MPRVRPGIKKAVVCPVLPQPEPTAAPTREPYLPESSAAFGDPISESGGLVYCFYKDHCPWCRKSEPLTSGLPGQIALPDGTASRVKPVCLSRAEDRCLKTGTDHRAENAEPGEEQYVPAVVIGERYLFAGEEIIGRLMDAPAAGEGLRTPLPDGGARVPE